MKRLTLWTVLTVFVLGLLAACVPLAAPTPAAPANPTPSAEQPANDELPGGDDLPPAVQAAIAALAAALQIDDGQINVMAFEQVDWPDSCLGIVRIDALCAAVVTPGYRVILEVGGREYEYHTDEAGTAVAPAFEETAGEKDAAVAAAVRWLANELGVPVEEIIIGLNESAEWPDSCLGQWIPGAACAEVITPGYRMILVHEGRDYEVHTNHNGSLVVSATVALNWHREGGIAGFNDFLVIYRPDSVFTSREHPEPLARAVGLRSALSDEEYVQWNRWLANYGQVEIIMQDDASADAMTTTLTFTGYGSGQPNEAEQQAMLAFAQELFNRMMQ